MATDSTCLAELLYMVALYRRHNQPDKAIRLLQDIILLRNDNWLDSKRVLAICLYNLADIYEDFEPRNVIARDLLGRAVELWNQVESTNQLSTLWYFSAMQSLQEETDRLTVLGAKQEQAKQDQDIA